MKHYEADYQKHVKNLIQTQDYDTAMSNAVGGGWNVGNQIADALIAEGLSSNMKVLDLGCGSGRISNFLGNKIQLADYLGIDIIDELLDYAKTKCPDNYRFEKVLDLTIPASNNYFDFGFCFSVFTHLYLTEVFLYLKEVDRTFKPGSKFVFSFLELNTSFGNHIFEHTANLTRLSTLEHLNAFMDRNQIDYCVSKLGWKVERYVDSTALWNSGYYNDQSTCIIVKK